MTILASLAAIAITAAAQQPAPQLAGSWEGSLAFGGRSIRVVLRVDEGGAAVMDSPDQGALNIPVEGPTVEGGVVRFGVAAVGGSFEGALSADGQTLTGALRQGAAVMPLVLTRGAPVAVKIAAPARPQTPQPPFPYREEEVVIDTPTDGVRLAGTLTLPGGDGPFPAVLLITGSGAQDRDETVFGHKPFRVLADALGRRGVAVLRVDDRGVGGSTAATDEPTIGEPTTGELSSDAAAAFGWLTTRPEVDPRRVGLIGHSEGGTIAPLVARTDSRVAFIVMIAGPTAPGGDILIQQSRRLLAASGDADADAKVALQTRIMAAIAAHADDEPAATAAVAELLRADGVSEDRVAAISSSAGGRWFRWFVSHDPGPILAALKMPVLALYGGRDVQVDADQNAAALRQASPSAEVMVLPELNHLMQTAASGLPDEYAQIEETIDPEALRTIVDWVLAHTGP